MTIMNVEVDLAPIKTLKNTAKMAPIFPSQDTTWVWLEKSLETHKTCNYIFPKVKILYMCKCPNTRYLDLHDLGSRTISNILIIHGRLGSELFLCLPYFSQSKLVHGEHISFFYGLSRLTESKLNLE